MKYLFLILPVLFLVIGCQEEKVLQEEDDSIYGTWLLTETYGNTGNKTSKWTSVGKGYTYTFYDNGTYSSTRFSRCASGTYTIKNDTLSLNFRCNGFDLEPEDYSFERNNNTFTWSPTYIDCEGGCSYKLRKIKTSHTEKLSTQL